MAVDQFYAAATVADGLRSQTELARQGFSADGRPPVREIIDAINDNGRLLAANRAPELKRVQRQVASLEKQDADLRRVLRTARPNAAERIALEIDQVAAEVREAVVKRDVLEQVRKPMSTSQAVRPADDGRDDRADREQCARHAGRLGARPARPVIVDGREEHAVAIWRTASDDGVTGRIQ